MTCMASRAFICIDVANAKRQGHGVLRLLGEFVTQVVVEVGRAAQRLLVAIGETGLANHLGHVVAEVDGERLPLDGEQTVALQVAKGPVVGDQLEAVVGALEGASRSVASVLATPDVGRHAGARGRSARPSPRPGACASSSRHRRVGEDDRLEHAPLAVGVEVDEAHRLARLGLVEFGPHRVAPASRVAPRVVGQVVGPRAAALGDVDALAGTKG